MEINLSNQGISDFPRELCFQKGVVSLILENNNLLDLPKEIINLINLKEVNLLGNNISLNENQKIWLKRLRESGCDVKISDNPDDYNIRNERSKLNMNYKQPDAQKQLRENEEKAYFFKLPRITDLTPDQQLALDEVEAIAISGGAGTGKTVVSLWRHLNNMQVLNKTSVLVTYTKTLGFYIQMSLDSIENKDKFQKENKIPPSNQVFIIMNFPAEQNWKVSEIIIDEAQDLKFETLQEIAVHGDLISYGADFNQKLYTGRVTEDEIEELFPNNAVYDLQRIFRNSYHILNFVKSLLPNFSINQDSLNLLLNGDQLHNIKPHIGIKPKLLITQNFDNEINKIIEIINSFESDTHNIAILLPFGSNGEESVENYHTLLSNKSINCSKYYNGMRTNNIEISNIHVTTYKSAKGLEFDTVIIPFIHKFRDFINRSHTTKVNEEDYYVAFTRTKSNLYLFSNEELDFISNKLCDINKVHSTAIMSAPVIDIDEDEIPYLI